VGATFLYDSITTLNMPRAMTLFCIRYKKAYGWSLTTAAAAAALQTTRSSSCHYIRPIVISAIAYTVCVV